MIYEVPDPDAPLTQGDIIDGCPLVFWIAHRDKDGDLIQSSATSNERVLVLTQACDLANTKTSKVQVAVVHNTAWLVDERILKGPNRAGSGSASPGFRLVFSARARSQS